MTDDPFGRKDEGQNPFGEDPPAAPPGWEPPTPGDERVAYPPPTPVAPSWQPPSAAGPAGGPTFSGGQPPTNGKATAALVLGILGLPFFCPLLCSIPALILGYQARKEIAGSHGAQGGAGNAKAGIIMGWVGTVVGTLGIIVIIVLAATGHLDEGDVSDEDFSSLPLQVAARAAGALLG